MANQFSTQQQRQIIESFKLFDKDNDGHLTKEQVAALIREMGTTNSEEQIGQLLAEIDTDRNGTIEPNEFLSLMAKLMLTITSEQDLQQSFKIFGGGQTGITFGGLKDVLGRMGEKLSEEDIMNLIKQADEDGDGKVSYEQFKKLMQR